VRVFITGSASHLAGALLPVLCPDARIAQVTGVDIREPSFAHEKFTHHTLDIRAPEIDALMAGCDALIHLAFVVLRGKMPLAEMRDINVHGTQRLFERARAMGVTKRIHLSSASVYGHGEQCSESTPLAPLPGFAYAAHKAELEAWFDRHDAGAIRLRPHLILGPHCQGLLDGLLAQPFCVRLPAQPLLQCVHEEDVAAAVLACLGRDARGPYNLATADAYSFREALLLRGQQPIALPFFLVRSALSLAWHLTGFGGEPAWAEGLRHPLTMDCGRAARELAWQPRYTAREVLATP
jgi:nucleoside-diphosphate-sugar epimerase